MTSGATPNAARPRVVVFALGGTIASAPDAGAAARPTLNANDLIAAVPHLKEVADIEAVSFRQLPSSELSLADIVALSREIARAVRAGAAGAVVTQGTDTLEETAFILSLIWDGEAPIVLTGAMRNPSLAGADGPANLLAAVEVARSPLARGLGALVAINDEIHLPLFMRKTHTSSPSTFRSQLTGPIGWVLEDRVRIALRPLVRHTLRLPADLTTFPPVALVKAALGSDGRMVSAVESLGYAGLVVEGTGGGHVPTAMVEPLVRLAQRIPVILASRAGAGEVLESTYGFPGSETDLLKRGLIRAGMLDGPKARVLLLLLLGLGADRAALSRAFAAIGVPGATPAFRWPMS